MTVYSSVHSRLVDVCAGHDVRWRVTQAFALRCGDGYRRQTKMGRVLGKSGVRKAGGQVGQSGQGQPLGGVTTQAESQG